ncbi:MAG TPA: hypothetical protein VJ937_10720 [Salinivirga sp.]|uniref:hypothetical protein n=1 Tax=Salinivirga sp. TaxID=1970192 RepID=UPI002B46FEDE|nr:hypothetical protein [Salinivirga sp.]HKK59942.1 hypothetical protein [Salinivirga sp.]
MKRKLLYTLLVFFAFGFIAEKSSAIPAFARKYRLSCKTCHSPAMPKLKPYGDTFAGNGFKLSDEEAPRYFVPAGDDKLSLIRNFPLAVRMDGFIRYDFGNGEKTDFQSPYLMKLLSGGQLSENLAYYFYFYMDERAEVAGVEDAFLMYNDLFNMDLDIYLGQFQVSDPLFKRELRLSLEDYHVYTPKIGISDISLTYDKGVMVTLGLNTGTSFVGEIVNGNGIPEAHERWFDKDKYKSYVARISQDIGDFLRIGAFAYSGREKQYNSLDDNIINNAFVWGPDLTLTVTEMFELNAQYLTRMDSKVFPHQDSISAIEDIETTGILTELLFMPKGDDSNWYLIGMFNDVQSNYDQVKYRSYTLHAGYLLRRNVRMAAEYSLVDDYNLGEYNKINVGFVAAF